MLVMIMIAMTEIAISPWLINSFKNGGLSRERVRKALDLPSWDQFEQLLVDGVPGNNGNIGYVYDHLIFYLYL